MPAYFSNLFQSLGVGCSAVLKARLWELVDRRMRLVVKQNDELGIIAAYPWKPVLISGKACHSLVPRYQTPTAVNQI
jgi:hypothetical protein